MTPNNEQREQGHCMAQASDYFGIAMIIAERDKLKAQRDALLAAAKRLTSEVIIGHENEMQPGWAESCKSHQCEVCYNSAKRLREVIQEAEK